VSKTFEEIWCHKEIMGSKNANALWRAGQKIAQEADAALAAKDAEIKRLMDCIGLEHHEIETVLGAALGYPWYKDDQKNFPGADESAGVCVGEHTVVSLADEAASKIAKLREELAEARKVIEELADVLHSVDENTAADFLDSVESKARAFLARKEAK